MLASEIVGFELFGKVSGLVLVQDCKSHPFPVSALSSSKESIPFEPIKIWLYVSPKKQNSKPRSITSDQTSSVFILVGVPPVKFGAGQFS